jgi:polyisoprenoid-binding protein YceI
MNARYLQDRGFTIGSVIAAAMVVFAAGIIGRAQTSASLPLEIDHARITIAGTTNVHDYTVATSAARVTRAQFSVPAAGQNLWDTLMTPGALQSFEIVVPAKTLASPKGDLDQNMRKALQVEKFPDIAFRLRQLDAGPAGALRASGTFVIAGVEREVTFAVATRRQSAMLIVSGTLPLLMTDYGIVPPKAMLGMLKTDPKVTITFEAALAAPAN